MHACMCLCACMNMWMHGWMDADGPTRNTAARVRTGFPLYGGRGPRAGSKQASKQEKEKETEVGLLS